VARLVKLANGASCHDACDCFLLSELQALIALVPSSGALSIKRGFVVTRVQYSLAAENKFVSSDLNFCL